MVKNFSEPSEITLVDLDILREKDHKKLEKRRQRDDESNDKFLDDLELLKKRSNPDEKISQRNSANASKFKDDGVRIDELKIMLATHVTLSAD